MRGGLEGSFGRELGIGPVERNLARLIKEMKSRKREMENVVDVLSRGLERWSRRI